jgi:hypothetical protein
MKDWLAFGMARADLGAEFGGRSVFRPTQDVQHH